MGNSQHPCPHGYSDADVDTDSRTDCCADGETDGDTNTNAYPGM